MNFKEELRARHKEFTKLLQARIDELYKENRHATESHCIINQLIIDCLKDKLEEFHGFRSTRLHVYDALCSVKPKGGLEQ